MLITCASHTVYFVPPHTTITPPHHHHHTPYCMATFYSLLLTFSHPPPQPHHMSRAAALNALHNIILKHESSFHVSRIWWVIKNVYDIHILVGMSSSYMYPTLFFCAQDHMQYLSSHLFSMT